MLHQAWLGMTWGRGSECSEFFVLDPTPRKDLVYIAETAEHLAAGMELTIRTAAPGQRSEGRDEIGRSQGDGKGL